MSINKTITILILFFISASIIFAVNETENITNAEQLIENLIINTTTETINIAIEANETINVPEQVIENEISNNSILDQTAINETNQSIVINESNQAITDSAEINKTINLRLEYENNELFDKNNDGVETIGNVIDFSVKNTEFNWDVNESNLCTRWKTINHDNGTSTTVCYGSPVCCNFVEVQSIRELWDDNFYLYYGHHDASNNNTASAQVIYVDYSLTMDQAYSDVYYSNWSSLKAVFKEEKDMFTKFRSVIVDKLTAIKGSIIQISARLVYEDEAPIPNQKVNLYADDELIGTKETDIFGYVVFDWNTSPVVPNKYLVNLSFPGQTTIVTQQTVNIMPSYNFSFVTIEDNETEANVTEIQEQITKKGNYHLKTRDTAWTIIKQDYITKYIDVDFSYINDSYYRVNWKWNDKYVKEVLQNCIALETITETNNCIQNVSLEYFPKELIKYRIVKENITNLSLMDSPVFRNIKNKSILIDKTKEITLNFTFVNFTGKYFPGFAASKIKTDINSLKSSPLPTAVIKGNANIIGDIEILGNDRGSFYINLKDGFYNSNGLMIKLGLNTTLAEFNNSKAAENLTFTGNQNITRYLELPRYANVTNATFDLKGLQPNGFPFIETFSSTTYINISETTADVDTVSGRVNMTNVNPLSKPSDSALSDLDFYRNKLIAILFYECTYYNHSWETNSWSSGKALYPPNAYCGITFYQDSLSWSIDADPSSINGTHSFTIEGGGYSLANDGIYYYTCSDALDKVYKWDTSGNLQTSCDISSFSLGGLAWNGTHLIVDNALGAAIQLIDMNDCSVDYELSSPVPSPTQSVAYDKSGQTYYEGRVGTGLDYKIYAYDNTGNMIPLYTKDDLVVSKGFPNNAIARATLTMSNSSTSGTNIKVFMTSDGVNWEEVTSGEEHNFTNIGSTFNWRANLTTNSTYIAPVIFEIDITSTYPSFVKIDGGNDAIYDYTNDSTFNGTVYDISLNTSAITSALNNGACDCDGCSLNGDNCSIPVLFHSDTAGNLEYSNINIDYETGPVNPKMYVNGTKVWNRSGLFYGPETIEGFESEMNNELENCSAINNSCNVSLEFSSDSEGVLELSLPNLQYQDYDREAPVINNIFVDPNPAPPDSSVNIDVNTTDNANITSIKVKIKGSEADLAYNSSTQLYEGSLNLPSSPGYYYINVTAIDSSNISTTSSNITAPDSECPLGIFCVSSGANEELTLYYNEVVWSPANPKENNSIVINATIYNFGGLNATDFYIEFKIDGVSKATNQMSVLAYSSNITQFNWDATAGNHTITIIADSTGIVSEDNETNNEANATVFVQDATPPSVLDIFSERGSLVIKLNITDNIGISSVIAIVNTTIIQFSYNSTSGLWGGSSEEVGPGTYPMTVLVIDSGGLTTTVQRSITVYEETIDLALTNEDLLFSPLTPSDGENVIISVNVHNHGINETANLIVELLIDDTSQSNNTITVQGDANRTVQFNWIADYGNHTVTTRIDADNNIAELNESNNEINKTIYVTDNTPPSINEIILPDSVYEASDLLIKANVTDNINISGVNATISGTTVILSYNTTTGLYENTTTAPTAGVYNVTVAAVDAADLLASKKEIIEIYQSEADLTIDFTDVALPNNITENNNFTINITVHNDGGTDADNFKIELLIDESSRDNYTMSVNKAETTLTQFTINTTYGDHNLTIKLDADNDIAESNESNNLYNTTFFAIDITPPQALNLTATPSNWTDQTTFNISWNSVADTNGISNYEYQIDYGNFTSIGLNTSFITPHQSLGVHTVYVMAVDNPGNKGSLNNVSVYIDTSPPNTPIIREWHCGNNWTQHNTPYLSWTDPGDEGSGITNFTIDADGQEIDLGYNLTYHSSNLTTGSHTFRVKAYDALDQNSNWSNTITVYIDTSEPDAPGVASPSHPYNNSWYAINTPLFNLTAPADDSGINGYYYIVDKTNNTLPDIMSLWTTNTTINITNIGGGAQFGSNETNTTNTTGLVDGEWYFHIIAKDNAGNVGENAAHYKLKIDTTGPAVISYIPLNNSASENKTPTIIVNYADLGAGVNTTSITLEFDGSDVTENCTINETTLIYSLNSNLTLGKHNATISLKDNLINERQLIWLFYVMDNAFVIKNSSDIVAYFDNGGSIVLKGTLEQNSAHQKTNDSLFVKRENGEDVLIIENNGGMYIDGTLFENQGALNSLEQSNDFRIKYGNELVAFVNDSGYIFIKGNLIENGNP